MLIVDVLSHLPSADQVLQAKVHAKSRGDQPDGRVNADRTDSLLHAPGREGEDEGHLQNIL